MAGEGEVQASALRLPWVVLGPRSQGRGYGVIHRSEGLELGRIEMNRLDDFALALAAWANRAADGAPESFVGFFRLAPEGAWLLCRARYLGRVGLGTVAVANALVLSPADAGQAWVRPHWLLPLIPAPEGRRWMPTALTLVQGEELESGPIMARSSASVDKLAGALANFTLGVEAAGPDAPDEVLGRLLDSSRAPRLVAGWVTSASLAANGGFDPASLFDLIVHTTEDPLSDAPGSKRRRARIHGPDVVWSDVPTSPARIVWEALFEAARNHPVSGRIERALASVAWSRDYSDMPSVTFVRNSVAKASTNLGDEETVALLGALAAATHRLSDTPEIQEDARMGLAEAFRDILPSDNPEAAAKLIDLYLQLLVTPLGGVLPRMPAMEALNRGALPYLAVASIAALCKIGLLTGMAAKTTGVLLAAPPLSAVKLTELVEALAQTLSKDIPTSDDTLALASVVLDQAAQRLRVSPGSEAILASAFVQCIRSLITDSRRAAAAATPGVVRALALQTDTPARRLRAEFAKIVQAQIFSAPRPDALHWALASAVTLLGVPASSPFKAAA